MIPAVPSAADKSAKSPTSPMRPTCPTCPLHGVRQIVRFNWPLYAAGLGAIALSLTAAGLIRHAGLSAAFVAADCAIGFWVVSSLSVSWLVYDHSPLMNGTWIRSALARDPRTWINIHAGFDETTGLLHALFPRTDGRTFDVFDATEMTERSIERARQYQHSIRAERVDFRSLPLPRHSIDCVFLLLSAHELRTDDARRALFTELHRVVTRNGCVIVAEHLRDCANFIAFGPGFVHFHSRRTWRRSFEAAGLQIGHEFSITRFVRIFILRRAT